MASLQSKINEMSIQGKGVVLDLTSETIKEVMAKPQMASWMRHCRDALQDYVAAVDRPVARPTGRQGGGCNLRDRLAYRAWLVLVESQRAYAEKFANPATLSSSQAANPLDSLSWVHARQRGGDNFTFKGIKFATSTASPVLRVASQVLSVASQFGDVASHVISFTSQRLSASS